MENLIAQSGGGGGGGATVGKFYNKALPGLLNFMGDYGGTNYISKLLKTLVTLIFIVGTTVFVFMLLYGAIKWIASGGDKAQLESARGTITNALIGLVLLVATFAIVKLIEIIMGVQILQFDLTKIFINA